MSGASGVVRSALKRSLPRRYSTVPVMATSSPASSGIEAIKISRGGFAVGAGDADELQFA